MVTETPETKVVDPAAEDSKAKGDGPSPGTKRKGKGQRERPARSPQPKSEPRNVVEPEADVMTVLESIPEGNYKVVSFAVDLTGKKTTDEICQVAAFVQPNKTYSQYVMPSCDVTMGGSKTHGIRVYVVFGKYRVLRSTWNRKILKTKSIYSTLNEFLAWLKEMKGSSDGVILTYHDHNHVNVPFFLSKAVHDFKMADEYAEVVKGIVNCADLQTAKPDPTDEKGGKRRSNTLFSRLRECLEPEMDKDKLKQQLQSARHRAELTYQLHAKVLQCKDQEELVETSDLSFSDLRKALTSAAVVLAEEKKSNVAEKSNIAEVVAPLSSEEKN